MMKYYKFFKTNLEISCIGLGTWVFGGEFWGGSKARECADALLAAIDLGVNLIDTAPVYGNGVSESIIGRTLKGKRDRVIIATKCGLIGKGGNITHNLKAYSVRKEIDESLKRLQTDYIDIYQCHWPDPNTDVEETLTEMMNLKKEGKIRYIGISNFGADLFNKACDFTEIITTQNQYSILERSIENEILPAAIKRQAGVLAYGPLHGGILSGKYLTPPEFDKADARSFFYKHYSKEEFEKVNGILSILKSIGKPLNQISINWVRQKKGVASVLVGSRNPGQLKENVMSINWDLTEDQMKLIDDLHL